MLNRFHVWFPGGIVIGGVLAWLIMDSINLPWQVLVSLLFIPLAIYGYLFFNEKIPETERVASGATYKEMLRNVGAPFTIIAAVLLMILSAFIPMLSLNFNSVVPFLIIAAIVVLVIVEGKLINKISLLFPFVLFCMLLTASTELGTNQWINALLSTNGINPMIILVVMTGIMAVGRFFAGGLIHRLNPTGVLLGSAITATLGLWLLSISAGATMTVLSAAVFAVGVCISGQQ